MIKDGSIRLSREKLKQKRFSALEKLAITVSAIALICVIAILIAFSNINNNNAILKFNQRHLQTQEYKAKAQEELNENG